MTSIKNDAGTIITDSRKFLDAQKDFYRKLYTSDPRVNFRLKNHTERKLKLQDKLKLDAMISHEEVSQAVCSLKNDKTPGNTGITAEFMQFFWNRFLDTCSTGRYAMHLRWENCIYLPVGV